MSAPVKKYNFGSVQVAVFENEVGKGKEKFVSQSIVINKSYKDKDGKWQQSGSFKFSEIPLVILALQQALIEKYRREEIDTVDFEDE